MLPFFEKKGSAKKTLKKGYWCCHFASHKPYFLRCKPVGQLRYRRVSFLLYLLVRTVELARTLLKSLGQAFSKACGSLGQSPKSPSAEGEIPLTLPKAQERGIAEGKGETLAGGFPKKTTRALKAPKTKIFSKTHYKNRNLYCNFGQNVR